MSAPDSSAPAQPAKGDAKKADKKKFKDTLNLPKTDFPMRAGLVKNEPASLERWAGLAGGKGLYAAVREASAGRPRYVFHDGPPYANGSIHLGHLMNKCLKDFVVRSRTMMGMDVPFVPGWDCHGLPIEHKVMEGLVKSGEAKKLAGMPPNEGRMHVRRACEAYANEQLDRMRGQMKRLLTVADYDDPYLTMKPAYEGAVLEVLAGLVERGIVYRALKPVHWSIANETALADAELEYEDREDTSVYVDFEAADADAVYAAFGITAEMRADDDDDKYGATPSLMIWTTTPWTLPANLAVAVNTDIRYALVRIDGNVTVVAEKRLNAVTEQAGSEDVEVLAAAMGDKLLGLGYKHPFLDEPGAPDRNEVCWTVLAADYVTTEDGTGLVHTAPGHGTEDYQTGLREGLPVYCPVLGNGLYDDSTPEWLRGQHVFKANDVITEHLRTSGHLFFGNKFMHSYPHDWRSKTPVIFRCTEQWFVGVDRPFGEGTDQNGPTLRERAQAAIDEAANPTRGDADPVEFIPAWGRNRMRGMLESRPDWCISRQRAWGLPIPAFYLKHDDGSGRAKTLMTSASVRAVATRFREVGSDAWFTESAEELLRHYDPLADEDAPEAIRSLGKGGLSSLTTGEDILDVWFESGSSWNAVMRERSGGEDFPVEVYLEGSDQHRGWFQLSMLPSLGVMGRPPYKRLFTHGFCVDKEGKKLSKSKGHTIENLFDKYGADVLRWWVSSTPYEGDVKVDDEFFDLAGESYRKIRNTLRFLLSNLYDFDPAGATPEPRPTDIDAWALAEFARVRTEVVDAYERFDFRSANHALYNFCNDAMSATYLAAVKDRLYCDEASSDRRRRTQAAMLEIAEGLCSLLSPILPHTADEGWRELPGGGSRAACVHLGLFPESGSVEADEGWSAVMAARDLGLKALEDAKAGGVENPLDAAVTLPDAEGVLARFDLVDLADLLGVSRVSLSADAAASVTDLRDEPRCERSRKRDGTVKERSDGSLLSDRDAAAVGV